MEQKNAVTALAALAQESRLSVFRLLVGAGPSGTAAGAIAERLGIAPATLSFHLSQLSHAGLVVARREGRSIIYSPDIAAMKALMAFLLHDCCGGRPELCRVFDADAEEPDVCCPSAGAAPSSRSSVSTTD